MYICIKLLSPSDTLKNNAQDILLLIMLSSPYFMDYGRKFRLKAILLLKMNRMSLVSVEISQLYKHGYYCMWKRYQFSFICRFQYLIKILILSVAMLTLIFYIGNIVISSHTWVISTINSCEVDYINPNKFEQEINRNSGKFINGIYILTVNY